MTITNEIINPRQAQLLGALRLAGGTATKHGLCAGTDISESNLYRVLETLTERALVTTTKAKAPGDARWCLHITITALGRRALSGDTVRRAELAVGTRVAPPTRNKMSGFYRPAASTFYRNDGHAHIASRGVGC